MASPSTEVERRFYSIVRWFGLIVTTLALGVAVLSGINGLSKLLPPSGTNVHAPNTTYNDFRQTTEPSRSEATPSGTDTTLEQKEVAASKAAAEADFERQLKPHLDAIVAHLGTYATKTDQAKPSAQAVGDYVRSNMQEVKNSSQDESMGWRYVEGLEKATNDLAADSERVSKLDVNDPRRVRWDMFLDWYTRQYNQQINAELQRIDAERAEAVNNAAQAPASPLPSTHR